MPVDGCSQWLTWLGRNGVYSTGLPAPLCTKSCLSVIPCTADEFPIACHSGMSLGPIDIRAGAGMVIPWNGLDRVVRRADRSIRCRICDSSIRMRSIQGCVLYLVVSADMKRGL